MKVLRNVIKIHKWVALIIGLQIAIWIMGGLVMSIIPIETVRGEHKIAEPQFPHFVATDLMPLIELTSSAGIDGFKSAELGRAAATPVWRFEMPEGEFITVDAKNAERLSPASEALARDLALADYKGEVTIKGINLLDNPPKEYARPGPVWQIVMDDKEGTHIYVDPQRAQVRARRSSIWRFYDFFWRLHIMDYDDGEDFNHPLLIAAAMLAIVVALSGLVLLYFRLRRQYQVSRAAKANKGAGQQST